VEEQPYIRGIEKLIGLRIKEMKNHPFG
jgi:hypothetical protein